MTDSCSTRIIRGEWYEDVHRNSCDFPIGPWNTVSNIAYPLFGAHAYVYTGYTLSGLAFLVAMCTLGVGSFLYHGFKYKWAHALDWLGMWQVFGTLWAHSIAPDGRHIGWVMLASSATAALLLTYAFKQIGANLLIGLMLCAGAIPVFWTPGWKLMLLSFGLFALAMAFWMMGKTSPKIKFHPLNMAGHGLWHVATAAAIAVMYIAQTVTGP